MCICSALVWIRNYNRHVEIFKVVLNVFSSNFCNFQRFKSRCLYVPPTLTYFCQDLNWCTPYRTGHLHRRYSKTMRLAYNVNCEPQISGRLSHIGILTKTVKGLWAIWKSPHMAIMHTRFCHYFICSGWEVQGNSDMTIIIWICCIYETISGMSGLGSLWLQVNVASLRRSRGKNRYCPTTYSESICCCFVKQMSYRPGADTSLQTIRHTCLSCVILLYSVLFKSV